MDGPGIEYGTELLGSSGMNGPGIESRWGDVFRSVQTGPEDHPTSGA
jgi:hypothetical protein